MAQSNGDTRDLSLAMREEALRMPGSAGNGLGSAMGGTMAQEEAPGSPVAMVLDRLHGRWKWFVLVGILLGPALAAAAWIFTPVSYVSSGIIAVERQIETKVLETPEGEAMVDFPGYVIEQTMLLRSDRVVAAAVSDDRMRPFETKYGARVPEMVADGLDVTPQKGTGYIAVTVQSVDPLFSKVAVDALMDAYMRVVPDPKAIHQKKVQETREAIQTVTGKINSQNEKRLELLKGAKYGTANLQQVIDERVQVMRAKESQLAEISSMMARILQSVPPGTKVEDSAVVHPAQADLDRLNPQLPALRRELEAAKTQLELAAKSYSAKHPIYLNVLKKIDLLNAQYKAEMNNADAMWTAGPGKDANYGSLVAREKQAKADLEDLRGEVNTLNGLIAEEAKIQRTLAQLASDERMFTERLQQLMTESDSLSKGRIKIEIHPEAALKPAKDRRVALTAAGGLGGFIISFAIFFLWGSVDKRAFGTSQLVSANQGKLLLAGAIPDMKQIDDDREAKDLASNCVHRIRTRIESRRTPGDGYALMVSSPFQGDGKTTLAVALAWSYAESGHRTLLVDCDFIGQALSFQFDHLAQPGVREALQGEDPTPFIAPCGAPTLSILPVGRDRQFGASRVHPTGLRRLFRELRNRYDILIIDTGPMTASIEALPVASAVDGVVLSLRRGRSRDRIDECIADINSVGAEYLGVVLNYAEKKDCMRYGSVSRMSVEITRALEGKKDAPARHPLLAAIQPEGVDIQEGGPKASGQKPKGAAGDAA